MNRTMLPFLLLGLSLAPALSWAAEPNTDQAKDAYEKGNSDAGLATKTGLQLFLREANAGKITFQVRDLPKYDVVPVPGVDKDGWAEYQGPDPLRSALGNDRFDHIVEATVTSNRTAQQLVAMPHLEEVFFACNMRVTDAAIDYLLALRELRSFHFGASSITAAGLAKLSALPRLERLEIRYTRVTDGGLAHLKTFPHLRALLLPGAITDAGLTHLNGLAQLEELSLRGTHVTDAGLGNLKGLTSLRLLDLSYTKVCGPGLEQLKELTRLRTLDLAATQVTGVGMEHLERLMKFQKLDLQGTQVTDAGLEHLKGLTQLRRLYLPGGSTTDEAAMKLQQALPNCKIQR